MSARSTPNALAIRELNRLRRKFLGERKHAFNLMEVQFWNLAAGFCSARVYELTKKPKRSKKR